MRIGSIVIHCHEFDRVVEFWRNVLNYVPREPAADGWLVLRDPNGRGPNLSFQAREKPSEGEVGCTLISIRTIETTRWKG
jgi:hypothetical protein